MFIFLNKGILSFKKKTEGCRIHVQEEFKIIETPKSADTLIFERLFGTAFLVQVYSKSILPHENLVPGIF